MIPFATALEIVMNSARTLGSEQVDISDALGRILEQDVKSDMDMPPFDKSAMDGYACRAEDLEHELTVVETIPAGYIPKKEIGCGECSKIMTGAMVPKGADCVIIVEETEEVGSSKVRFKGTKEKDQNGNVKYFQKSKGNICYKGEDIKLGDLVLSKGVIIQPQHIAVLATVGCVRPYVSIKPKVGIIATGSELVEPYDKAEGPSIRNSNSYQLSAQIEKMGTIPSYYGIAEDTEEAITSCVKQAISENDVVLVSGGVSMGDYDFVPQALKNNGIDILFDRVAIQPGKPVTFGVQASSFAKASADKSGIRQQTADPVRVSPCSSVSVRVPTTSNQELTTDNYVVCFGLPGNPVSTFVQFEILVKPLLYKMQGHDFGPNFFPLILGKTINRRRGEREALIPVFLKDGKVHQVDYHGSAHINAMCLTEYLVSIPVGITQVKEGTVVDVRQI